MGCGKDLAEDEKLFVIWEMGRVKAGGSIVEMVNRCVVAEMSESERIFGAILQTGNVSLIAVV